MDLTCLLTCFILVVVDDSAGVTSMGVIFVKVLFRTYLLLIKKYMLLINMESLLYKNNEYRD